MRIHWMHSGHFGSTLEGRFMVTVVTTFNGQSSTMQQLMPANARSVLFAGLTPYSYNSSQGVQVTVSVQAINGEGEQSVAVSINGGTLPCKFLVYLELLPLLHSFHSFSKTPNRSLQFCFLFLGPLYFVGKAV